MKSILDLCRSLPDSEPEIREREREFDETVRLATEPETYGRQYLRCISDAKAATDAVCAMGYRLEILYSGGRWTVEFYRLPTKDTVISAEVFASTEELARSAACVLAAEAMKEKR